MKVLVYVGGAYEGINTPVGGEGRWALNLVDMLASFGHEVHCLGTGRGGHEAPQWGQQKPIRNVHFLHIRDLNPHFQYDAFLNVPWDWTNIKNNWEHCPHPPAKAHVYVHCMFSWNESIEQATIDRYKCIGSDHLNHIVSVPYPPMDQYPHRPEVKLVPLHLPFFKDLEPVGDLSQRKSYTWACKDVFLDEWPSDMSIHTEGLKILQSLVYLSDKYSIQCNFISAKCFSSNRAQRLGASELFDQIKHKNAHPGTIPLNELKGYMQASRCTTQLPGYFAGCWDSVVCGAVALCYEGCNQNKILTNSYALRESMSSKDVQDIMERLYIDDQFYTDAINLQRKMIEPLSYQTVHQQFLDIMNEVKT